MYSFGFCDKISTGDSMRLRNVKNKEEIMNQSTCLIRNPEEYFGKWKQVFSNSHPIYVEIGMGKGQFIIQNALAHPENNYIGIEKYDSVMAKALLKVPEGIPNLKMVRADALSIDKIFDHEINGIYLNFSDPWPKKRHHLRRLSSRVFLEKYDSIFQKEPWIEMRTDNRELFQYSLVSFSSFGYTLEDVSLNLHQDQMPTITTEYEDKFSNKNMPIYFVRCTKVLKTR